MKKLAENLKTIKSLLDSGSNLEKAQTDAIAIIEELETRRTVLINACCCFFNYLASKEEPRKRKIDIIEKEHGFLGVSEEIIDFANLFFGCYESELNDPDFDLWLSISCFFDSVYSEKSVFELRACYYSDADHVQSYSLQEVETLNLPVPEFYGVYSRDRENLLKHRFDLGVSKERGLEIVNQLNA